MGGLEQLQEGENKQGGWAGQWRGGVHPTHHLVSFPSSTGWCARCTLPYFLWLSPPEVPPFCDIDEVACIPHAVFFFCQWGGVHLAYCFVFIHFFPPRGGPSPRRSTGAACIPHTASFGSLFFPPKTLCIMSQCGSHMPPCLCLFFPLWKCETICIPHVILICFFFSLSEALLLQ